jgi:Amt family ammonium transporter
MAKSAARLAPLVVVALLILPVPAVAQEATTAATGNIMADRLWVLIAGAMVFLMQTGFLCLEVGCVRPKAATITALKNVVDWTICAGTFFFVGWGIMFGHSLGTLFGKDCWLLEGDLSGGHPVGVSIHFLFQLAFAGTAATIVSGALAERTSFHAYMVCSFVVTALTYPVIGHWAWGNSFFPDNQTLLTQIGFLDFAGSTVVHSVGGWVALMAIWAVGPRLGRFAADGKVNKPEATGMHWTAVGVLILWFAWWGFNGGSTLALNDQVGPIIINTNVAATCGGIGAMLYCYLFQNKDDISSKFLNGILAGLVGITANCFMVSPVGAVIIGLTSGVIAVWGMSLLLKMKLDDPVGAVPVHLGAGIWGTLCVGLFGKVEMFPNGHTRLEQIGVQLIGIAACALWVGGVSFVMFRVLKTWVGLRVSPYEETMGFDIGGAMKHTEDVGLTEDEARKLLAGQ